MAMPALNTPLAAAPAADTARVLEHLTDAQRALRQRVETVVDAVSPQPRSLALDRDQWFDTALRDALAEAGVLGLGLPEQEGGSGGSTVEQAVALEVLGRKAASMAVYCVVSFLVTRMLRHFGSAAQRSAWLPRLLQGRAQAAFCRRSRCSGATPNCATWPKSARPRATSASGTSRASTTSAWPNAWAIKH